MSRSRTILPQKRRDREEQEEEIKRRINHYTKQAFKTNHRRRRRKEEGKKWRRNGRKTRNFTRMIDGRPRAKSFYRNRDFLSVLSPGDLWLSTLGIVNVLQNVQNLKETFQEDNEIRGEVFSYKVISTESQDYCCSFHCLAEIPSTELSGLRFLGIY